MPIFINKNNIYLLQNSTRIMHIYKQVYISLKKRLHNRFLAFNIHGLYCNELIFYKRVNLEKPRYWNESKDESYKCTGQNRFPETGELR